MFDPKTKKFPYPEDTASHYIILKKDDGTVVDKDYPYYDHSRKRKTLQGMTRVLLYILVFWVAKIRTGLRVHGRKVLKENKDLLKKGVVSCSNHVHFWDFIAVMYATRPFKPSVLVWENNIRGENGKLMKNVRGVPIPSKGIRALHAMSSQTCEHIKTGSWVHIYSEGSMWEYYMPIRPFKDGAAYYAVACDRPLLPMAFSYRRPGWIRRVIFKQIALLDLHIGEPLLPNKDLPYEERKMDLLLRSHRADCELAGIKPEENIYPPVYDHSRRIDYY